MEKSFTLEVDVTEDDIDHGERGMCFTCPIARAVGRAAIEEFGEPLHAAVRSGSRIILFHEDEPVKSWQMVPDFGSMTAMNEFIQDFDGGNIVEPFKATLKFVEAA